jgi:hypothetical protein
MVQTVKENKTLLAGILILVAFFAGRFTGPKRVETKEVEKIVYKDRVVKDDKRETRLETRETILPDGTIIRETIKVSKKESSTDSRREYASEKEKQSSSSSQSQWSVGLYSDRKFLAGTIDRRILGGLFLGLYGRSDLEKPDPEVGVGLRLEF